ncbi:hypothetical protein SEVIR_5G314200v4 [Setaria viridis]|uniref:Uncharacterized protein n=3 Tax=Setaria TaxID=4554 RepID=K3XLG5_SETIT|nr:hypothetical protein SEVIR_5G314200v2 [Setaria viridis]
MSIYIYPFSSALAKVVKERKQEELRKNISIHPNSKTPHITCSRSFLGAKKSPQVESMGGFSGATGLPVYREYDDEDLFETSSSISGDSDGEDQFSDGEGAGALDHQFMQQAASSPAQQSVRRLNSDSLYDLSSMMAQLPVKKGLSKFYDGKSQSFACMSEVRCLEDLRKKETPYKKIKPSRSYLALDEEQECHMPGPNSRGIAKKPSGGSCANLASRNNSNNMLYRPPPIPVNKGGYHQ